MFSMLALFAAATMAVFAAALPRPDGITNSCNGGSVYCCNSVQPATSSAAQQGIAGLGLLAPISGTVGLTCDPISVLAAAGNSCSSQTTCCSGNNFNGAVVLGCSPTNVNV